VRKGSNGHPLEHPGIPLDRVMHSGQLLDQSGVLVCRL
jgi:hypothetical protein